MSTKNGSNRINRIPILSDFIYVAQRIIFRVMGAKKNGRKKNSMFIFGFSFDFYHSDKVTLQKCCFTELNTLLGKKLILFV